MDGKIEGKEGEGMHEYGGQGSKREEGGCGRGRVRTMRKK